MKFVSHSPKCTLNWDWNRNKILEVVKKKKCSLSKYEKILTLAYVDRLWCLHGDFGNLNCMYIGKLYVILISVTALKIFT